MDHFVKYGMLYSGALIEVENEEQTWGLYCITNQSRCQTKSLSKDLQNIRDIKNFKPLHPNISIQISHTVLYTFPKYAGKENLFNNQKVLQLIIISFILMTLMFDSGMILKGKIRG